MTRTINLLGSLEIKENDQLAPIMDSDKGCALLAYTIVTGQSQRREVLGDLLWEAKSTKQSLQNLRTLLHRIKKLLPELAITRSQISFQPTTELSVDFLTLTSALQQTETMQLDEALKLYRGDLLDGFYLRDAPRFNEWLSLAREQLRQKVLQSHRQLCATYAQQFAWQQANELALRWIKLDDFNEEAYRWVMETFRQLGQLAQAKQQYEALRQHLWQELGVKPESATQELAEKIEQQSPQMVTISPEAPPINNLPHPGPLPTKSYLPYPRNNVFIGRQPDLQQIASLLFTQWLSGLPQTAVITGMGGLGKSQLAIEFAHRYGRYFTGGVYWLNFEKEGDMPAQVANIGGQRGMRLFAETDNVKLNDKVARVQQAWQEDTPRLLIFDNCESETLLADWLPVTGNCSILVTSRRGIWSPALPLATYPLPLLARQSSIHLLQKLAPTLTQADADLIAQEVADLPLALYLAGGFLRRYPKTQPHDYLAQLQDQQLLQHASLQGDGTEYSPTGHELHVARTFALAFDRLQTDDVIDVLACQLLASAAYFAPGEPIPQWLLQQSVTPQAESEQVIDIEEALLRLITFGFLQRDENELLTIHRLVCLFTLETTDKEIVERSQTAVENTFLHELNTFYQTNPYMINLPFAVSHLSYITNQALPQQDETAMQLADFLGRHLFGNTRYESAAAYWEASLQICQQQYGQQSEKTAVHLNQCGWVQFESGYPEKARHYYEQSLAILERCAKPDPLLMANTLRDLGALARRASNYTQAKDYIERSLVLRQQAVGENHELVAQSYSTLGGIWGHMGHYAQAAQMQEKALAIYDQLPDTDPKLISFFLHNIAVSYGQMGNHLKAMTYTKRSLMIREQEFGHIHSRTVSSANQLGQLLTQLGDYSLAQKHLDHALTGRIQLLGDRHLLTNRSRSALGFLYLQMGDLEQSETLLNQALDIYDQTQPNYNQAAETATHLAKLYIQQAHFARATVMLDKAMSIWQVLGKHTDPDVAYTHMIRGDWYLAQQQPEKARLWFEKALEMLKETAVASHPYIQRLQNLIKNL